MGSRFIDGIAFHHLAFDRIQRVECLGAAVAVGGMERDSNAAALPNIDAAGFAQALVISHDIEDVVDNLKCQAYIESECSQRFYLAATCIRQLGANHSSGAEERSRFERDNIHVHVTGEAVVLDSAGLQRLTLYQGGSSPRQIYIKLVIRRHQLIDRGEEKVPGQQRKGAPPNSVHRWLARGA